MLHLFAKKKKKTQIDRITVEVSGVDDALRRNIYSHLAIYRLRNSSRLQQVSVNQLFLQAKGDIAKALAPFGYYNPKIESSLKKEPPVESTPQRWRASFTIEQGEPVTITATDIALLGDGRKNRRLVQQVKTFAFKKGDLLNQKLYEQEKKKLVKLARREGYLDATFSRSEIRIDPEENRGRIFLTLSTGEQFCFGETKVVTESEGDFDNALLQGYLPWKEGDSYDVAKLFELQSILNNTGFFALVDVRGKPDEAVNGRIPVEAVVRFQEKNNKYTIGFGYATDTGMRGKFKWKNKMLGAAGDKVGAELAIAEREKNISLSYERPTRKNPRYDHYLISSSYQEKSWNDTDTRLFTVAAGRDYASPALNLGANLEFRDEVYDIGDTSGDSTLLVPSANIGFVFADDMANIKNGLRLAGEIKGAAKDIFSDADFVQWTVSGKIVLSPFSRWRFSDRAVWGVTVVNSIDSIPPSLRFYAGGDNSIRGYAYKSIGTKDSAGKVIGGRYLLVQSAELERLFGKYFGLAAFWDVGTATDDLSLDFEQGVGLGLRVHMPFGEIKLDVASAISEPDFPFRIHFSVGGTL